jgi:hypothetical protein
MKILTLLFSLLFIISCNEDKNTFIDHPITTHKELDKNKKLWKKTAIKNYSFVVKETSFYPIQEKKHIIVNNGLLTKAKFIPSDTPIEDISKEKNIDDYFDIIKDALDKNAYKVTVSYDKKYGFPSSISIDYNSKIADEEMYYTITHFNKTDEANNIVCTAKYAPVCAKVDIKCITTPCEPIEKTFSNRCFLNANPNATYLRDEEC